MRKSVIKWALGITFFLTLISGIYACTGLVIDSKDGSYIRARTLEFADVPCSFDIIVVPQGIKYQGQTPDGGLNGLNWTVKHGFIGFNPTITIDQSKKTYNAIIEGMNEQGLSVGGFFFTSIAQYQTPNSSEYSKTLSSLDLPIWILSTCATVDEVIEKLPELKVCMGSLPGFELPYSMHWQVADAAGNIIVIEYCSTKDNSSSFSLDNKVTEVAKSEDGLLRIYKDTFYKIITNSPDFPTQISLLNTQYFPMDLTPWNKKNNVIEFFGKKLNSLGQGSGLFGLPGNFVPEQRFVQAFYFLQCVNPSLKSWGEAFNGDNSEETMKIAFHILNQFDIVKGYVRENPSDPYYDVTQWTTASDLNNKIVYFNTYENRAIRKIDLREVLRGTDKIITFTNLQEPENIIKITSDQFAATTFSEITASSEPSENAQ